MKLDAKVKGGLAWAGLFVILAVPSADILFGRSEPTAQLAVTADTEQVAAPRPVRPVLSAPPADTDLASTEAVTPDLIRTDPIETAGLPADGEAVEGYLKSGRKLPSYISDAESVPGTAPAKLQPLEVKAATPEATEVAVLSPQAVAAPVPLPRSARPRTPVIAAGPIEEAPLILDETEVKQREASLAPVEPFPLSDGGVATPADDGVVTADQLEEWDSGSLADYLARKGLLSGSAAPQQPVSEEYDPDGFYLDEGPNVTRRLRQREDFWLF